MVKKLSCVCCGSLKRFPHTFTSTTQGHALTPIYGHLSQSEKLSEIKPPLVRYFSATYLMF